MSEKKPIWIARDYVKCSGCRLCEIACSIFHEKKIWPEASTIRVFMLVPGAEIPHFCTQCQDYPCVVSCPLNALTVSEETGAVLVDREKCTACGICIDACPGRVPHMHPTENYVLICDLCGGDPKCVKACHEAGYDCLWVTDRLKTNTYKLYAKRPEEATRNLAINLFGERGKELI